MFERGGDFRGDQRKDRTMDNIEIRPQKNVIPAWFIRWVLISTVAVVGPLLGVLFVPDRDGVVVMSFLLVCALIAAVFTIFWIPMFWSTLKYTVQNDRVTYTGGVFFKKRVTAPYTKVTNINIHEGPIERIFGVGRLSIQTAGMSGQTGAELIMYGISDLDHVRSTVYERIKAYQMGVSTGVSQRAATSGDDPLTRIHEELVAIRKLLERQR
jgi:membrane protein YdbS with pleckstrin-like domain